MKNNDLAINGKIDSANFSNFGFDLAIDADNFKAINSKEKDNASYYGELYLDNHLKLSGNLDNPIVEGNIKLTKTQNLLLLYRSQTLQLRIERIYRSRQS
jgi:hypothetical protein